MAVLCNQCGLPSDGDQQGPLKMLPCGHMACVACIDERAQDGGQRCPICNKILKVDVTELATYQTPEAHRVWCRDCDAVARAACLEEHSVCGQGPLRREAAAALAEARAARAAALRALAEDVRMETQQLQQEPDSASLGLVALRQALAAARSHPLHGLHAQPGGDGGLLRRALHGLRQGGQPDAVQEKEARTALEERERVLDKQKADLAQERTHFEKEKTEHAQRKAQLEDEVRNLEKEKRTLVDLKAQLDEKERGLSRQQSVLEAEKKCLQDERKTLEAEKVTLLEEKAALQREEANMSIREEVLSDREAVLVSWQVAVEGEASLGGINNAVLSPSLSPHDGAARPGRSSSPVKSSSHQDADTSTSASPSILVASSSQDAVPSTSALPSSPAVEPVPATPPSDEPAGVSVAQEDRSGSVSPSMAGTSEVQSEDRPSSAAGNAEASVAAADADHADHADATGLSVVLPNKHAAVSVDDVEIVSAFLVSISTGACNKDGSTLTAATKTDPLSFNIADPSLLPRPMQAPCWVNKLPNEVLEQVLALVPADPHGDFMRKLRRVCRRWAELIKTSAAIWRHRTLSVKFNSSFYSDTSVLGARALRCAPVLGCLDLEVKAGLNYQRTRLITSKVEHCQTKVFRLQMSIPVNQAVDRYAGDALNALRPSLRDLDLHMTVNGYCVGLRYIVNVIKRLNLTSLKIGQQTRAGSRYPLDWDLGSLTKLERLVVGSELSPQMVRILVRASGACLLDVDFGDHEIPEAAATCSVLRTVTAKVTSQDLSQALAHLLRVRTLEKLSLVVRASTWLRELGDFLDRSSPALKDIHLTIAYFKPYVCLRTVLPSLDHRIRFLELHDKLHMTCKDLEECLSQLTRLSELRLYRVCFATGPDVDWNVVLVDWVQRAVLTPDLRDLHVHVVYPPPGADQAHQIWVAAVQALRPALRICPEATGRCFVGNFNSY